MRERHAHCPLTKMGLHTLTCMLKHTYTQHTSTRTHMHTHTHNTRTRAHTHNTRTRAHTHNTRTYTPAPRHSASPSWMMPLSGVRSSWLIRLMNWSLRLTASFRSVIICAVHAARTARAVGEGLRARAQPEQCASAVRSGYSEPRCGLVLCVHTVQGARWSALMLLPCTNSAPGKCAQQLHQAGAHAWGHGDWAACQGRALAAAALFYSFLHQVFCDPEVQQPAGKAVGDSRACRPLQGRAQRGATGVETDAGKACAPTPAQRAWRPAQAYGPPVLGMLCAHPSACAHPAVGVHAVPIWWCLQTTHSAGALASARPHLYAVTVLFIQARQDALLPNGDVVAVHDAGGEQHLCACMRGHQVATS